MSDHFQGWAASNRILLEPSTLYHQQTDGQSEIVNQEVVTIVPAYEIEADQWVKKLEEIPLRLNSTCNWSRRRSPFHTLYAFTLRFGLPQMHYPLNKVVAHTDRHVQLTNILKQANERQSLQANKRSNQPPRCKIAQKVMLLLHSINLPNVNQKMKSR